MTTTSNGSNLRDDKNPSEGKSTKLNNQLVELLEGLNNRKSRIDEQVKFLLNLPKILPFEPLPPDQSNVSRKTWEKWCSEHDRIEREAGFFREDEFALMKKVAMSKTTNMSREDTDLVGLTLGTLEAFSKLEHLLRSRRKQLQILDLRIKWDQQTSKVWQDLTELGTQLPTLLSKIRWTPPSSTVDQLLNPSAPQSPTILPSSHLPPSGSIQSTRSPLSRSLQSRKEAADHYRNSPRLFSLDHTPSSGLDAFAEQSSANLSPSHLSDPSASTSSINSSLNPSRPYQLQHDQPSPRSRKTLSCIRTTSAPTCNNNDTSSLIVSSSYSSAQSRAMRIQSLALQLSSVSTKFHTLNRSVVPTSNTIDKLIDSGLHVPEIFLDLQDKLEAAVRSLQPPETGRFFAALMEQHKEADDIWFNLFHLGLEIESSKREIDRLLSAAQIDPLRLIEFDCQFDQLSKKHDAQHFRAQLRILPTHPNYPDQPELNQLLIENLQSASKRARSDLDRLNTSVKAYRFATETWEESKILRASMEKSKDRLTASINAIESLNEAYPHRAWLMNDPNCLAPNDRDNEYEIGWEKIMVEMKEQVSTAFNLLDTAKGVLKKLNAPGGDPNVRSDCCQVRDALKKTVDQAQQISTSKQDSDLKLTQIRGVWEKILAAQSEVGRLRDQLLLDAHREKWRMRKVSPTSPPHCHFANFPRDPSPRGLPSLEELRRPTAPSPALFQSPQNAENYILQSLQPHVNSTLDELTRQKQHLTVHQHIMMKFDELRSVQVPQLVKLERTVELIHSQTSQVREAECEYDVKVIEGGRWMKKVQDLINVQLESYEEDEKTVGRMHCEARLVHKSRLAQTMIELKNYLSTIDQFCDSLTSRIPFIAASQSDPLVMQNGRVVLSCQDHDESVRSYLIGLSMYLMGLKTQICNESCLLEWTNSAHVKEFDHTVENVEQQIEATDIELQRFKADIQRLQNLIESNPNEPFLTDEQIEQAVDEPLYKLSLMLDKIENRLNESTYVHLEAFIASCPGSSTSGTFQPDQFILPKQMSHHQLQALYNQTRRELDDIDLLANLFKNETNARRKEEVAWRAEWARTVGELTDDCEKVNAEILKVESDLIQFRQELDDWDQSQFKTLGQRKLAEVYDQPPKYLEELAVHELRLAKLDAALGTIQNENDDIHRRATVIKLDIEDRLSVFIHLTADLFTLMEQSKCRWMTAHELGLQVSASTNLLKQNVEAFLEEYDRRVNWNNQCLRITGVDLHVVDESFVRFDEVFDEFSSSQRLFNECYAQDDEADQNFITLLDSLRLLNKYRTTDLDLIQSDIEASRTKLSAICQEVNHLSPSDVPHLYLVKAEAEVCMRMDELGRRFEKLEAAESELSTWLCRLNIQHQSWLEDQLEQDIISKHCQAEQARLTDWGRTDLDRFINLVVTEDQQIENLHIASELLPPQHPIESLLHSTSTSTASMFIWVEIGSDVKDQVKQVENMVKSASDIAQRLEILDGTQSQLAKTISAFQQTLPAQCSKHMEEILNQQPLECKDTGPDRFGLASSKLEGNHTTLKSLIVSLEARLATTKELLHLVQTEIAKTNVLPNFCDRLSRLGLDRLVDIEANSPYSPLPTQDALDQALQILDEADSEIKKIPSTVLDQTYLQDCLNLLKDQKHKVEILGQLVSFQSAVLDCDQSFSTLIDILDVRRMDTPEIKVAKITESAQKSFDALLKASENVTSDPRVESHTTRSKHTWNELLSIVKENKREQPSSLRRSTHRATNLSTSARPPLSNQSVSRLAAIPDPALSRDSTPGTHSPRPKHSSVLTLNRFDSPTAVSDSPTAFMNSPSYTASRRCAQDSLEAFHDRSGKVIPKFPARSLSRQSEGKKPPSSHKGNASSINQRHRLHSIQGTPTRPAAKLLSKRTSGAPNTTPTLYKPQPNRNIDKLVGNVVNRFARNQFTVHVAPADGWEDNSGMYWIGEKIYFCRILRSQTVMVRIGGGWSELSAFLMEHLRLTTLNNASQVELRTAGGSERVVSVEHSRRASISHSTFLPGSVISSCDSSPRDKPPNVGKLSDSTSTTPASSVATVLITTPNQSHTSTGPSPNEKNSLSHSTSQPNSFSSTPTETIQMFLRKAENRSYLSNNYIHTPHPDTPPSSDTFLKINRSTFSPASGSSALPPSHPPSSNSSSILLNLSTNTSSLKTPPLPNRKT